MNLLNWEMLKNPLNWLTVFLMVAFAIAGVHLLSAHTVLFDGTPQS